MQNDKEPVPGKSAPDRDSDIFLGENFREYHLKEVIGFGGMGTVYKAYHIRLRAERAIKILKPELLRDESFKGRFEREACILARLEHPNLIRIYEFFQEREHLFLVMEYAAGESLADKIENMGSIPADKVIEWISQACDGLAHAHSQGVVHRDLSPDNIIITQSSEGKDHIKIIDFGIAKTYLEELSPGALMSSDLTLPGVFVGKIKYCSPEQAMGRNIDHRSDQYSLTLILYEALTGKSAFISETPMESLTMRLHEPPPKLSEVRPGSAYPSALQQVIDKALERSPSDRYPDMAEFKKALLTARIEDATAEVPVHDEILAGIKKFDSQSPEKPQEPAGDSGRKQNGSARLPGLMGMYDEFDPTFRRRRYATPLDFPQSPQRVSLDRDHPGYRSRINRRRRLAVTWIVTICIGIILGSVYYFERDLVGRWTDRSGRFIRVHLAALTGDRNGSRVFVGVPEASTRVPAGQQGPESIQPVPEKTAAPGLPTPAVIGDGPFLAGGQGIDPPRIVSRTEPVVPRGAEEVSFPVTVLVQAVILKTGQIGNVEIVNPVHPMLDRVAMETVKSWKFNRGTKYGRPADIIMILEVEFTGHSR
ncbi:protein kinase [bacterium]|nr:protein kinase [candidate division CSSED10-310 bacterium]